jgi:hypothetical protein
MSRRRVLIVALGALAALLAAPSAASATTKEACIRAFDTGQQARRQGALRRAREELLVCSQQECPAVVRADCGDVLRQVDAAQPTIVLKAASGNGNDLTDVTVDLDGQRLASSLDGRAIPVDPGKLSLVFRRPPAEPVAIEIVIAEGEKSRIVRATLGPAPQAQGSVLQRPALPKERRSVAGYLVPGGLALASAGALTFAGISRLSLGDEADELRASCAPTCSQTDRDRMSSDLVMTNVGLGVGIAGLAFAVAAWFVFAPKAPGGFAQAGTGKLSW